jgi:prepilin-type N-terminal cleavage/methylation domain-containing protein
MNRIRVSTTFIMKSYKPNPLRNSGFTLVELLVVITIIVVLASLVFLGAQRGMASANKSRTVSQMREIGVAVATWAAENNNNEPMYFRDGSGDSSTEATPALNVADRKICAGNPAILLYNKTSPGEGYLQKPGAFFAAIQTWDIPSEEDYDPSRASTSAPWGSFMWVYPSVPADERTDRQKAIMRSSSYTAVGRQAYNNCLMFNDFSFAKRKYPKDKSYYALFRDTSVRNVAPSGDIWGWFYRDR